MGMFLFLLAYWVAFMVNASFDVFLEGLMGGIWFWTLYGVGLGAMWIYQRYPEILEDPRPCRVERDMARTTADRRSRTSLSHTIATSSGEARANLPAWRSPFSDPGGTR
jgi:hypothetical protein